MKRVGQFCAFCGCDLDTGWECNGCGHDWMESAFPWWDRPEIRSLTNSDLNSNSGDVSNTVPDKPAENDDG